MLVAGILEIHSISPPQNMKLLGILHSSKGKVDILIRKLRASYAKTLKTGIYIAACNNNLASLLEGKLLEEV